MQDKKMSDPDISQLRNFRGVVKIVLKCYVDVILDHFGEFGV